MASELTRLDLPKQEAATDVEVFCGADSRHYADHTCHLWDRARRDDK